MTKNNKKKKKNNNKNTNNKIVKTEVLTKKDEHKFLKNLKYTSIILGLSIIIGTILLGITFLIPNKKIEENLNEAAEVFYREGTYLRLMANYPNTQNDNYTDALIFLELAYDDNSSFIKKSMYVYRYLKDENPVSDFVNVIFNGNDGYEKSEYGKYWHGNLVIVKPLLTVFNYSEIRIINSLVQTLLVIFICYLMAKKKLGKYIPAFIVSLSFIVPPIIGISLQYSSIYYVFLISSIVMLYFNDWLLEKNRYMYLFMLIGILSVYLDLLTYPVFALCMALVFYFLLNGEDFKTNIINLIKFGFMWCLGYFGMWTGKWVIGSLLCNDNFFVSAISSAKIRSASYGGRFTAIGENLKVYCQSVYYFILGSYTVCNLYLLIKNKVKITKNKFIFILPLLVVIFIPLVWYFGMSQHSLMHTWFTCRSLGGAFFALLCIITYLCNDND